MKSKSLFWGAFFICIGIYFALNNFYSTYLDLSFVSSLWPLIIIFWGLKYLGIPKEIKLIISAVKGMLVAILIIYLFSFNWLKTNFIYNNNIHFNINSNFDDDEDNERDSSTNFDKTQYFPDSMKVDYSSKTQIAELNFSGGAGRFTIKDTSKNLIEVNGVNNLNDNNLNYTISSDSTKIHIDYSSSDGTNMLRKKKQEVIISLNPNPIWDINFESGAGKFDFDLSNYKLRKVNIETGASNSIYKFGSKSQQTNINLSSGMAHIILKIPKESGCYISTETFLTNSNFSNFKREGDNFKSYNFNNSKNKIYINLEGAFSKYQVIWY